MAHDNANPHRLTELRAKIDAVDESIHALIMQRASVIDELIRIKGADRNKGAAFRPGREAAMMKVFAGRHGGSVPFSTIVHFWREIISTFTWLQAPYGVHVAGGDQPAIMQDMARFHFGFTVEMVVHGDAASAMTAASQGQNDLVVVPVDSDEYWWDTLDAAAGFSVMARLPIANTSFKTVDAFVLSPPLSDPVPFDVRLYTGIAANADSLSDWSGGHVVRAGAPGQRSLIAIDSGGSAPHDLVDIRAAGGYFAPATTAENE